MLKITYAGCLDLSSAILSQFIVEACAAARKCKKVQQNPVFGGSGSFKVIDVDKSKKAVTSACYDMQQVIAYLQPFSLCISQLRQNNVFLEGCSSLTPLFEGNPSPSGTKFCHDKL